MADLVDVMDQQTDVEVTTDLSTGSDSGFKDLLFKAGKFVVKKAATAAIVGTVGGVCYHYTKKACLTRDEKARIRKAEKEAGEAEAKRIADEKAKAKEVVETSDEGQKVLKETDVAKKK